MTNYGHADFVPLIWHVSDELSTSETQARSDYYGVTGIPDTYFDGTDDIIGGWPTVYDDMEQIVLSHLQDDPYVAIDLSGSSINETGGTVNAHLTVEQAIPWGDVKVFFVVYEDSVEGQYMFTVRDLLPLEPLSISQVGQTQDITTTFTIDPGWPMGTNPQNVGVAVFLQSVGTQVVLNACTLSKVDAELSPETATVPLGGTLDATVDLTNITPWPQSFEAWLDVILPNGNEWSGNPYLGPVSLNLAGGQTISRDMAIPIPGGIPTGNYRLRLGVGDQARLDHWEYDYMDVTVTP